MGTRWQHVSALKELSKIHVPVLVTPSSGPNSLLRELALVTAGLSAYYKVEGFSVLVQDGNGILCLLLGGAMEAFQLLFDRL